MENSGLREYNELAKSYTINQDLNSNSNPEFLSATYTQYHLTKYKINAVEISYAYRF